MTRVVDGVLQRVSDAFWEAREAVALGARPEPLPWIATTKRRMPCPCFRTHCEMVVTYRGSFLWRIRSSERCPLMLMSELDS